jgi:hypothetical protein
MEVIMFEKMNKRDVKNIFEKYLGKGFDYETLVKPELSFSTFLGSYIELSFFNDIQEMVGDISKCISFMKENNFLYQIYLNKILFITRIPIPDKGIFGYEKKLHDFVSGNTHIRCGDSEISMIFSSTDNYVINNIYIKECIEVPLG